MERSVSGSTCEVLPVFPWDVLALTISVAFGEAEVDDEHFIFVCATRSNQEIIRFDISVNQSFLMHGLDVSDHLNCTQEHSLEVELALASLEQILKRGPEEIHHHHMVVFALFCHVSSYVFQEGNAT